MRHFIIIILTIFALNCLRLSAQSTSKAVPGDLQYLSELTLGRSPIIQRQRFQIDRAKSTLQIAKSAFDYLLSSQIGYDLGRYSLFDADPREEIIGEQLESNNFAFSSGLQRTFRTGLTANASLDYSRTSDNFPLNEFSQQVGAYFPNNYSGARFSLSQPLLRGRGRQYAAGNEQASAINVQSTQFNLLFVSSGELQGMVLAYWQYLAHYQSVAIYQQNETRVRQVLEITKELVEADKKPAGDLVQIQADLADKERQTLLARQQLYSSRQNLGRYIGLSEAESEQIGTPTSDFPTLTASGYSDQVQLADMIELAHQRRADLKSIAKTQESLEIGLSLANNSLKPQLDVGGFVSYGGAAPGPGSLQFVNALGEREGRNVQFGVSLNYLFPLNNNRAQGNVLASKVGVSDQEVLLANQIRNIDLNVSIAFNNLKNSVLTLEKARQTLDRYQQVFDSEQVKFQNGLTTILNLILFQERLTFAQLDYLSSQQQFARALIQLRYETGTLLSEGTDLVTPMGRETFYALPTLD